MTTSKRFGFVFPDGDDYYDISEYNGNMQVIEENAVNGAGVMTIIALTSADYDSLSAKDTRTLYLVTDGTAFSAYLGEIPMKSGGGSLIGAAVLRLSGSSGTITGIIDKK